MNEYTLSVDKFERPQVKKDNDAIYLLLVRLLLRIPGSSQTHPTMGVGLVERYRYINMEDLSTLQNEISSQISKFLPQLNVVTVKVEAISSLDIRINIQVDNTLYILSSDFNNQTIKLSDL